MTNRFNLVGSIIGGRGTGKSLFVLGSEFTSKPDDRQLKIPGLIRTALNNGFKVFSIDTLDHPAYKKIPILTPAAFPKFKSGVARVFMEPDKILRLVDDINRAPHFNNTFLIFEDAGKYTEYRLPPAFKRLIADSKQRNIDILFVYHCWADTPNDVFKKGCDYIQLFKTSDSPEIRKPYLSEFNKVMAAHTDLQKAPGRFAGKYIDISTQ